MEKKTASAIMLTLLLTSMLTLAFNIQPAKSNPETVFFDDFNDGVADGWTEHMGTWTVINGEYLVTVGLVENGISTVNSLNLADCIIEANVRFRDTEVGFRAGIVFRYIDNDNYYAFELSNEYDCLQLDRYCPGNLDYGIHIAVIVPGGYPIQPNTDYLLRVIIQGSTFRCFVDNQEVLSGIDGNYTGGKVGLRARRAHAFFDNFTVLSVPSTIIVPDNYPTIQEAINNANEGDTIFVRNGTYYEHVVVNKTVSLIGENRETAIIDGNGTGKVVHIVIDNVNTTQFTIRNSGSDYPDGGGIYLSDSRNCNISFNILTSNYVGLWLWGSSHNYLMSNIAFNNSCGAIELRGSVDNILVDNNMSRNLRGINMPSSSNNLIINNTATYNTWDGIHVYSYSSYNVFVGNDLSNNDFSGIDLDSYSSNNNLTGNTIHNNSEEGIRIGLRCMFNALTDNSIMDGKKGIHLYDWANNNTLISNTVSSNQYGIWFDSWPSSNNTIFHNNFVNNSNQVYIKEQINNIWDDGYPSGGNYWSDYTGVDLYSGPYQNETGGDGVGDTQYIIDENNTDRYSLMKPYAGPHDVGIKTLHLLRTIVGQGYSINITATITNYGEQTETFNVTIYANQTIISEIYNISLTGRNSTTALFTWNTTGFAKGNYTISAVADTVLGETDASDNTFVDGLIKVSCVGDLNGDYVTDAQDYQIVKNAIPSMPELPKWNPNADLNDDGVVDGQDFQTVKNNIGQSAP